jgi:transcriptional regulator with XRE-family HTH domain
MNTAPKGLRYHRQTAGLTQKMVADHLGISQSYYNKIEHGRSRLDSQQMLKLSKLFSITMEELL